MVASGLPRVLSQGWQTLVRTILKCCGILLVQAARGSLLDTLRSRPSHMPNQLFSTNGTIELLQFANPEFNFASLQNHTVLAL